MHSDGCGGLKIIYNTDLMSGERSFIILQQHILSVIIKYKNKVIINYYNKNASMVSENVNLLNQTSEVNF